MFIPGQPVQSVRTRLPYTVLGYDEDTLDGQQVVIVSAEINGNIFQVLASTLEEVSR